MRHRRPAVLLILAAAALQASAGAAAAQLQAGGRLPSGPEAALGETLRALLNESRADAGLAPLAQHPELDRLAYQHSHEMAQRGRVSHHSYVYGLGTRSRIKLAFPRVYQFAENVARNRDPQRLHAALLASPGHRLNRMDPAFTHVGVGVSRAAPHEIYVTEIYVRVGDLSQLTLDVLYTDAEPSALPRDEPTHGEVTSETITVRSPGQEDPAHWTGLGIDAFQNGRYSDAVAHFLHALALAPDYEYARFNLGRALLRDGRAQEALTVLTSYLETHAEDLDAWRSVGTAALVNQEYARAESAFRTVLGSGARDAAAWYNLGLSVEYQDRVEEAELAYTQALHLDPELEPAREALRRVRR